VHLDSLVEATNIDEGRMPDALQTAVSTHSISFILLIGVVWVRKRLLALGRVPSNISTSRRPAKPVNQTRQTTNLCGSRWTGFSHRIEERKNPAVLLVLRTGQWKLYHSRVPYSYGALRKRASKGESFWLKIEWRAGGASSFTWLLRTVLSVHRYTREKQYL